MDWLSSQRRRRGVTSQPPWSQRCATDVLVAAVRAWSTTWHVTWSGRQQVEDLLSVGPVVLAFWHEDLSVLGPLHADRGFVGMVSRSDDGERLSRLLHQLGYETVRGSTSRGALGAARAGLRTLRSGRSVAIAVDGPRGPRRSVSPGAATLARWARVPLVLVGCHVGASLRLGTWDAQRLPAPFARVHVSYRVPGSDSPSDVAQALCELGLIDPSERSP